MIILATLLIVVVVLATVAFRSVYRVPTGHVGLVYRKFGKRHPDDLFTVRLYGSPGPQAETLEADHVYFRLPFINTVGYMHRTYVPPGTIGVVVAKAGAPPPQGRVLGEHVECNHFQDGQKFLANGGQMGRQQAVLRGGASYAINPWIFDVVTVANVGSGSYGLTAENLTEVTIPEGSTGVVIALEGESPDDAHGVVGRMVPGHQNFQCPWVFLAQGGQRGAQEETLSRGVYAINPWFARIVLIPTRDLILEWEKKANKPCSNFDSALDDIVINVEGSRLRFTMSQTIRIPAKAAPRLVGRFGEKDNDTLVSRIVNPAPVQRFVERVLGRAVEGYFHSTAADYRILEFLDNHNEVRLELEERVRHALAEWDVEAVRTTLGGFESLDTSIDEFRRKIAMERDQKHHLEYRAANVEMESRIEEVAIAIERDRGKISTAKLEDEVRVLGEDRVALERLLERLASMNVPDFMGSDPNALLNTPMGVAQNLINRYLARTGSATEEADPRKLDPVAVRNELTDSPVDQDPVESSEWMTQADTSPDSAANRDTATSVGSGPASGAGRQQGIRRPRRAQGLKKPRSAEDDAD